MVGSSTAVTLAREETAMQVGEIVSGAPYSIQDDEPVLRAAQEMRTHNVGALPVFKGDKLVGIITDRDITIGCVAGGHSPAQCRVVEHMTADPVCIAPGASLEDAMQQMGREQVRRLCVADGEKLLGIVSLGDLAVRMADSEALARTLAEISQPVRMPLA
jgi:CBS domain-containing protein